MQPAEVESIGFPLFFLFFLPFFFFLAVSSKWFEEEGSGLSCVLYFYNSLSYPVLWNQQLSALNFFAFPGLGGTKSGLEH
jgi:hypothetical protein